jgi:hypothetical protein
VRSSPEHPTTNGLVERLNRTLKSMLSHYMSEAKHDWDELLPYAVSAYNRTRQATLGCPPLHLMVGIPPCLPTEVHLRQQLRQTDDDTASYEKRLARLEAQRQHAMERLAESQAKQQHTTAAVEIALKEGDRVYRRIRARGVRDVSSASFQPIYRGPYVVVQFMSDRHDVVRLAPAWTTEDGEQGVCLMNPVVNVSLLKFSTQRRAELGGSGNDLHAGRAEQDGGATVGIYSGAEPMADD